MEMQCLQREIPEKNRLWESQQTVSKGHVRIIFFSLAERRHYRNLAVVIKSELATIRMVQQLAHEELARPEGVGIPLGLQISFIRADIRTVASNASSFYLSQGVGCT